MDQNKVIIDDLKSFIIVAEQNLQSVSSQYQNNLNQIASLQTQNTKLEAAMYKIGAQIELSKEVINKYTNGAPSPVIEEPAAVEENTEADPSPKETTKVVKLPAEPRKR